jgi:hypothetical protein
LPLVLVMVLLLLLVDGLVATVFKNPHVDERSKDSMQVPVPEKEKINYRTDRTLMRQFLFHIVCFKIMRARLIAIKQLS